MFILVINLCYVKIILVIKNVFKLKNIIIWMFLMVCMYNIYFYKIYILMFLKIFINKYKYIIWDLWFVENYLYYFMFFIVVYIMFVIVF